MEFPSGWKSVEVSGSKSVANCGQTTYRISMCFDDSLPFHGDVENPIRYALKVANSCFENAIRYSLSRRFDAAHLFNTEEETEPRFGV
jgi:hypothetical protein